MSNMLSQFFICFLLCGILLTVQPALTFAQSQAIDAEIDGTVADTNSSVIANASLTAINVETGAKRSTTSSQDGSFRLPLLSLGVYSVVVESPGFKRFERHGITLSVGQTALIVVRLEAGRAAETVTVTSDVAIADASKFEIGHLVNSRDVKNLPLLSRNPYNFALLQPGVNGRTVSDPLAINLSAAGLHRRVGYQIDGGYNNDSNMSGFRLNLISETFVKEVQLLSNGYSAEFGNTAGVIVNVVTPSGSNDLSGTAGLQFRPAVLSSKPFDFDRNTADPNISGYGVTGAIGGPIIKNRWHFYAGYEWLRRNTESPVTINPASRDALIASGLSPSIFSNIKPTSDTQPYFLVRTDVEVTKNTRASFRYNRFDAGLRNAGTGGLATTERSSDLVGYDNAFAAQAVTSFSETFFNEFRFQYAKRRIPTVPNDLSATGVSVTIKNVADFGPEPAIGVVSPNESTIQFQNAVTKVLDAHAIKVGGGSNFITDQPTDQRASLYIFPSVAAYSAAVTGTNRKSYSQYLESFGDSQIPYRSVFLNFFFQDDWRLSRRLKIAAGIRYELYRPPVADAEAPLSYSRNFSLDRNNFAPRFGLVYLLRDGKYRTVVRIGSGVHYDPPLLKMYRRAILNNGNPRYFSFSFTPGGIGAPEFPNRLGTFPSGMTIPPRDIDAVASDFRTMYAVHSNVQVEQEIAENTSFTVGFLYSVARHIPVYRNTNCLPIGGALADGRPIYGTLTNPCTDRMFPQFKLIKLAESVGNLNYQALFVQLTRRFSNGLQFNANYTLSRSRDDAPEENEPDSATQSDPSNRAIDKGYSYGDIPQVLNVSLVAKPAFSIANRFLNVLSNHNQIGVILLADSGKNFNFTTIDLNGDGVSGPDRPVGVPRNFGRLPAFLDVNARYSRFFKVSEKFSFEFYAEATNIFNSKQVSSYDAISLPASVINPLTGELRGTLPDASNLSPEWLDSRQIQLGIKIHF